MMSALSWLLALAGFAALALAMDEHHEWLLGVPPAPARRLTLRLLGGGLLAVSFLAAISPWGVGLGTVAWCGLLTAAAGPLVLARTYGRPRRRS